MCPIATQRQKDMVWSLMSLTSDLRATFVITVLCMKHSGPYFNIKTIFQWLDILIMKIRWLSIFIIRIFMLPKQHLYCKLHQYKDAVQLLHILIGILISMGIQYKKDVTPLLTHWSYIFLALTHLYTDTFVSIQVCHLTHTHTDRHLYLMG